MYTNKQLMEYSIAFENSSNPFSFYQTNIILEPDRAFFPYTNWFRGKYTSCLPIIADREAGFYPRTEPPKTSCVKIEKDKVQNFATPCYRGATQQMRKCYTTADAASWVQTDPSYLGSAPIVSYI